MQVSVLTDPRSKLSRAALRRLIAVAGRAAVAAEFSPDLCERVSTQLVDAFLDDRITVKEYRVFIDAFS